MKKTIFCLIITVALYGCAMIQPAAEESVESCVYECEVVYEQCKIGCTESLDGFAEAAYQEQCKFNCRKYMNKCKAECRKNNDQ